MVGEHPTQTSLPGDDLKPAWRVACVAYRKVRQEGKSISPPGWPLALPYRSYDQTGTSVLQVRKLQRRCTTRRRSIRIGCGATLAI